jgi:hypothetical protein
MFFLIVPSTVVMSLDRTAIVAAAAAEPSAVGHYPPNPPDSSVGFYPLGASHA